MRRTAIAAFVISSTLGKNRVAQTIADTRKTVAIVCASRLRLRMPSTATQPTNPATMTKAEVQEFLGKSKRSVETYVSDGRLPAKYFNGPNGKTAIFERADVEAFKRSADEVWEPNGHGTANPGSMAVVPARGAVPAADMFAGLAEHLARLSAAYPPPVPVLGTWATLDDAAKQSGLPKSYLVAQAKSGAPFALNVGSDKRAAWRFRVEALTK